MVFSSLLFVFVFLSAAISVYHILPGIKLKNAWLIFASLAFYAFGGGMYTLLLILCVIVNYICGNLIIKYREKKAAKVFLVLSVALCLSLLGVYKYSGLFLATFEDLTSIKTGLTAPMLPIGISFYTFQAMSYTIDVYRGDVKEKPTFWQFLMFVSMFPQLIAGPIVRYTDIINRVADRRVTLIAFAQGLRRFLTGLAKKVLIADYSYTLISTLLGDGKDLAFTSLVGGMIYYTFYIYFDFSGYSDMAIGMGKMLGFDFPENFNYPYISDSITEFWRRWHMTLSTFFRDYVYIPLGGNRCSKWRQVFNLLVVWGLTGFWHGASWNFLLWGLYYFVVLVLEKFVWGGLLKKIPAVFRHIYTLVLVFFGWILFYFDDFSALGSALLTLFGASGAPMSEPAHITLMLNNIPFFAIAVICCFPIVPAIKERVMRASVKHPSLVVWQAAFTIVYNLIVLFACTAALVGSSYSPFLYFRF